MRSNGCVCRVFVFLKIGTMHKVKNIIFLRMKIQQRYTYHFLYCLFNLGRSYPKIVVFFWLHHWLLLHVCVPLACALWMCTDAEIATNLSSRSGYDFDNEFDEIFRITDVGMRVMLEGPFARLMLRELYLRRCIGLGDGTAAIIKRRYHRTGWSFMLSILLFQNWLQVQLNKSLFYLFSGYFDIP